MTYNLLVLAIDIEVTALHDMHMLRTVMSDQVQSRSARAQIVTVNAEISNLDTIFGLRHTLTRDGRWTSLFGRVHLSTIFQLFLNLLSRIFKHQHNNTFQHQTCMLKNFVLDL